MKDETLVKPKQQYEDQRHKNECMRYMYYI